MQQLPKAQHADSFTLFFLWEKDFGKNFLLYIFIIKYSLYCFLVYLDWLGFHWLWFYHTFGMNLLVYFQDCIEGWNINVMGNQTREACCNLFHSQELKDAALDFSTYSKFRLLYVFYESWHSISELCRLNFVLKNVPSNSSSVAL